MPLSISKKSWLGVAREATSGTAITTPTLYVPCKSNLKNQKKREYLSEERGTRDKDYDVVDTTRKNAWDIKGPWYNDTHVYFLIGAMGSVSSAQPNAGAAPAVYKHTLSFADVPPSLTLMKSYAAKTYYAPYSVVEKFVLKFSSAEKLLECDASGPAIWMINQASPPTPTYSTLKAFAGYMPTIQLTGGATSDIIDFEFEFDQKWLLWNPANASQDWVTAYPGDREAKFKFTARFDNDTLYQRFLQGVNDTLTFDAQGPIIGKLYTVTLGSPSAGTFTLTYNGQTTGNIAYNATSATVQTALQGLSSIGSGNATVSGSAGGPYTVSFLSGLLNDGNALTGSGAGLTGGTFSIGAPTNYNQELNLGLTTTTYDTMEHDLGKENVLIKAAGKVIVAGNAALFTAFVQNTITGYTV